jgi:hypothetical protein
MSDGGGLYLWITPPGGKLWRWKYRFEGREKLMTFGSYPDVSLSLARERHAAARKLLATATDPMAERKAEKAEVENSFQSVARLWLAHWQDGKSPRHVDYVKRRMDADILPCLGARPIALIEAPELVAMTKAIDSAARATLPSALWRQPDKSSALPLPTDTPRATRPARFAPAIF